ncbi:hypothetical protein LAWI1_G008889, partial [Lachnellula willkommii]
EISEDVEVVKNPDGSLQTTGTILSTVTVTDGGQAPATSAAAAVSSPAVYAEKQEAKASVTTPTTSAYVAPTSAYVAPTTAATATSAAAVYSSIAESSTAVSSTAASSTASSSSGNKKGLLYEYGTDNDAITAFFQGDSSAGSAYSWSASWCADTVSFPSSMNIEQVPQLWGLRTVANGGKTEDVKNFDTAVASSTATHYMGFNEPDECGGGGSCISVTDAQSGWKTFASKYHGKKTLVSPSVTNANVTGSTPKGLPWLSDFLLDSDVDGTVDVIGTHWYGGSDNNIQGACSNLLSQIDAAKAVAGNRNIGDLLAQITGEPRTSSSSSSSSLPNPPKRKAPSTDTLQRPADKLQRTNPASASSSTSRPSNRPSTTSSFENGQPTPPPNDGAPSTSTPAKPPKKGSFAEIMARGKAVQATRGQVGQIRHKRIEKLPSKREMKEMKGGGVRSGKNTGPGSGSAGGKFQNGVAQNGKSGAGVSGSGIKGIRKGEIGQEPEKKVKKAAMATTGYSGTARPKPGSSSTSKSRPAARPPPSSSKQRYTYASEGEEDEEEEDVEMDQGGYASDVSSDMEAAAFEVDEEEEFAARMARKEDAEALAEENRLKKEKAEKKKRLMEMAARRR